MSNYALLLTLLSSIQIIQSSVWYGSKFKCLGRNKCYDDQIHCDDNRHCTIECSGPNACQYTVIHCPINAQCEVTCNNGIDACKNVVFLAERSSSLSISCDRSQDESCDETIIYCPNNGRFGPTSCQISGINQINVKSKIEIFAIEGLHDVEITGTYVNKAFLYCGRQYKYACTLTDTSPFNKCISNDKTCENYLLPTSYPSKYPTLDPTDFPTDQPTPYPSLYMKYPTIDPTDFPTDNPTPYPTPSPTHYPTHKPTAKPTFSESHKTTKRPTKITTKRPTKYTRFGSLLTTTNQGGYGVGDDKEEIDPNGVEFTDKEIHENTTNFSPLYYVVSALLVSVCYISVSLFCWVHYNHKYASRVIELKRHSRLQSPAIMPPGVVWQANHIHEPGAVNHSNHINCNNNYLNTPINNIAPSVVSNITAPTTISRKLSRDNKYNNYNNIEEEEEEEQQTIAPTSIKSPTHSHYTENNSEFKEVDYETNGKRFSKQNNSITYNYIHDDESIVQYGEAIKDGPKETHSLKVSNISDFNVMNRYNSIIIHGNISEKNDDLKEIDIETCLEQNEIPKEPIQPLMSNIYNKHLIYNKIISPPINESISISGSPSQMYITGNNTRTGVPYAPQYGQ